MNGRKSQVGRSHVRLCDLATDDFPRALIHRPPSIVLTLRLGERPLVMGILNVTPDSFADARPRVDRAAAVAAALRMEADGADIIDIGGESTRPGAVPIPEDEERARVLPVLRGAGRPPARFRSPSTPTRPESRAPPLLPAPPLVNDISGLRLRSDARRGRRGKRRGARADAHARAAENDVLTRRVYGDVIADVVGELRDSIATATAAGVSRSRVIVDPGIGFAKRAAHSYGVLARLPEIAAALDRPLLVGPVAQVVHAGGAWRPHGPPIATGGRPRPSPRLSWRRPHRTRARRSGDGAGRSRR